jgi:hypothetical protein
VPTFVPGGVLARYKCVGLTFVPGGATNRYKCEAFVSGGLDQAPTSLCERTFVPVGCSNRYKYHHLYQWKKYPVQIKMGLIYMCDSPVMIVPLALMAYS